MPKDPPSITVGSVPRIVPIILVALAIVIIIFA